MKYLWDNCEIFVRFQSHEADEEAVHKNFTYFLKMHLWRQYWTWGVKYGRTSTLDAVCQIFDVCHQIIDVRHQNLTFGVNYWCLQWNFCNQKWTFWFQKSIFDIWSQTIWRPESNTWCCKSNTWLHQNLTSVKIWCPTSNFGGICVHPLLPDFHASWKYW